MVSLSEDESTSALGEAISEDRLVCVVPADKKRISQSKETCVVVQRHAGKERCRDLRAAGVT